LLPPAIFDSATPFQFRLRCHKDAAILLPLRHYATRQIQRHMPAIFSPHFAITPFRRQPFRLRLKADAAAALDIFIEGGHHCQLLLPAFRLSR